MMRGLSRWQLPILTVADRVGSHLFQRLPDRRALTIMQTKAPLVPRDAVPCSNRGNVYGQLAAAHGLKHVVVGSKPGTRVASGCYHIQNVNSLHARYQRFIKRFSGPATDNLDGYMRRLEV